MKTLIAALMLTIFVTSTSFAGRIKQIGIAPSNENAVVYIMNGQTTTGAGSIVTIHPEHRSFQATVTGTGAVTATVIIQVCNHGCDNEDNWIDATLSPHIDLSGTTTASDGFTMIAKWAYSRGYVEAISGTDAAVTITMGI